MTTNRDFEELENSLSALAHAAFHHKAWEDVQRRAGVTLERSQVALLKCVLKHPGNSCRLQHIAQALGIEAPSVSRTAQLLEADGLLRRKIDATDKRASIITLTAKGERQLAKLQQARRDRLAEAMQQWSQSDRQKLTRLLDQLSDDITKTYQNN